MSLLKSAVAYLRVSSREQKREGFSIPAQKRLLTEFANKNKFKIVKFFEDDETAKRTGRAGFNEMVEFLKENKDVNTVLVEKTDRLYRNLKDYVTIDELGITVYLVKENEKIGEDANSHQKLIHGIKVLMAKNYTDNLSEEVKKGQREKAEMGIYPGSMLPVGYKIGRLNGKSGPIIDYENKMLPIKMFEYYSTGLYSLNALAEKIKEEGLFVPDKLPSSSRIKTLTKGSVQGILRHPLYRGNFIWKKKIYQGIHEPLINKNLWDKVQRILDSRSNAKIAVKYNTLRFAYKGFMVCGECGRNITATRKTKPSGKEYVYYNCTKYKTNCSQKAVTEPELDKQVITLLGGLKVPQEAISDIVEGLKQSLQEKREFEDIIRESVAKKKNQLEKQLDTLYSDRLDGTVNKDFYKQKSVLLSNQIERLDEKISEYSKANVNYYKSGEKILELAKNSAFLFKNANLEEKQELLNFLLWNSTLKNKKLDFRFKIPFNSIFERASCSDWRGRRDSNSQPLA